MKCFFLFGVAHASEPTHVARTQDAGSHNTSQKHTKGADEVVFALKLVHDPGSGIVDA
jgi:hypothetical protein